MRKIDLKMAKSLSREKDCKLPGTRREEKFFKIINQLNQII
jgi:hypothetical protein